MFKTASELQLGDILVEGKTETPVRTLDKERCKNKVHVNDKDCYEAMAEVFVKGSRLVRTDEEELLLALVLDSVNCTGRYSNVTLLKNLRKQSVAAADPSL